jgi:hypothetical protein
MTMGAPCLPVGPIFLTQFHAWLYAELLITISAAQGFPEQVEARHIHLVIHRAAAPHTVFINGQPVARIADLVAGSREPGYNYHPEKSEIVISAYCPTTQETRLQIL